MEGELLRIDLQFEIVKAHIEWRSGALPDIASLLANFERLSTLQTHLKGHPSREPEKHRNICNKVYQMLEGLIGRTTENAENADNVDAMKIQMFHTNLRELQQKLAMNAGESKESEEALCQMYDYLLIEIMRHYLTAKENDPASEVPLTEDEEKKVNLLQMEQQMLRSQLSLWYNDVLAENDLSIDIETLSKTHREFRNVQHNLIINAIAKKQDTEPLIEEDRKFAKIVNQIREHLKPVVITKAPDEPQGEISKLVDKIMDSLNQKHEQTEDVIDIRKNSELYSGPKRELNILLIGETGSGKSTTINALANYLLYNSFDNAANGDFMQLIPTMFTLPHPETGEPFVIKLVDENELHAHLFDSIWQWPRESVFHFGNLTIRIIDTPGIDGTRDWQNDKNNFEKIFAHLAQYKELHGICILIKATQNRKTNFFRFCINELLTYLHKDAVKNMAFLFTFSRNSFYGPGDGFSTLKSFLSEELKDSQIQLISKGDKANCFFIDNEAFRYLVAKKNGYPFTSNQEQSYRESWHTSVDQTMRMFNRFLAEQPHSLNSTLSLIYARKVILQLAEPLARLQSKNSSNIQILKEKEESLDDRNKSKEELAQSLNIEDFVKKLKKVIVEFEEEMDVLHDVSAFFSCILRTYSNTPYNRFLESHLNLLIEEEEKKINASDGKYSDEAKKRLVEMRDKHRQTVMMMETAIKNNTRNNVELKEIDSQIERLRKLKHSGRDLAHIMETIEVRLNKI